MQACLCSRKVTGSVAALQPRGDKWLLFLFILNARQLCFCSLVFLAVNVGCLLLLLAVFWCCWLFSGAVGCGYDGGGGVIFCFVCLFMCAVVGLLFACVIVYLYNDIIFFRIVNFLTHK